MEVTILVVGRLRRDYAVINRFNSSCLFGVRMTTSAVFRLLTHNAAIGLESNSASHSVE